MAHKLEGQRAVRRQRRKPWRVRLWLPCARIDVVDCDTQTQAFAVTVGRKDALRFEVFGPSFYRASDEPMGCHAKPAES